MLLKNLNNLHFFSTHDSLYPELNGKNIRKKVKDLYDKRFAAEQVK